MNRTIPPTSNQSIRLANNATATTLDRRALLKTGSVLGLSTLALGLMPRAILHASAHQDATVEAATPVLGAQADGTNLWKVQVGGMDMENSTDLQAFFPSEITINAGDQIWFAEGMPGFHTVAFGYGDDIPPMFIPDPELASPVSGPPQMLLNPAVIMPSASMAVNGVDVVNTGVDILWDPTVPTIVSFPTAGTFDYLCIPHQGVMRATVIVQDAGADLPLDQAGYDAKAQEQMDAVKAEGIAAAAAFAEATQETQADGSTLWTAAAGAGEGQARVMRMLPNPLEIKVGDSVKWINQSPGEPHTITFIGAGETPPEDLEVSAFADGTPKFSVNPMSLWAQGGNTFDGSSYLNSGYFGVAEAGQPMEFTATFTAPGEFTYYCILHGDAEGGGMAATLTVVE